jgi:hypothetical protein
MRPDSIPALTLTSGQLQPGTQIWPNSNSYACQRHPSQRTCKGGPSLSALLGASMGIIVVSKPLSAAAASIISHNCCVPMQYYSSNAMHVRLLPMPRKLAPVSMNKSRLSVSIAFQKFKPYMHCCCHCACLIWQLMSARSGSEPHAAPCRSTGSGLIAHVPELTLSSWCE